MRLFVRILVAAALAGCAQQPIIPRQVLFGNPARITPQVSPDGTMISFIAPLDGVLNVWVAPAPSVEAAKPVTHDTRRGIRRYAWAYTSKHILYLEDEAGDENWRLSCVDVASGASKVLTPQKGVQAQIQELSPNFPEEVLVRLNDRDPKFHDIHRINLLTGERKLVLQNDRFNSFVTDDTFAVRFATRVTEDGGSEIVERAGDGWKPFMQVGPDDAATTRPFGFDKSRSTLYMIDSRGRNTAALVAVTLADGAIKVVAADERSDIAGAMVHPTEKTIEAAAVEYKRREWIFLDKGIEAEMRRLATVVPGAEVLVTDRSLDDRRWIVEYADIGPRRYYFYDRATHVPQFLFVDRPELEEFPLAGMEPVVIRSRDGLDMVGYLTQPKPAARFPLVLLVHGGPWARDHWGFHPYHQWLADRGYAVLSVNYRGSTGFGKEFLNRGDRQWGAAMQDDLLDAVRWAIDRGIADPAKVAIMGGSYGGYAVLAGLTMTPDVFACGVDIVGPSNLETLLKSIPPYWTPLIDLFTKRVGDHRTDEGRKFLASRSPLTHVDRITKPLLIAQGANDPRVKQSESDQIVKAMQAKKIPVTYAVYADEGHGFARPPNTLSFNAVAEAFLARNLGGVCEPIGDDFEGSSIRVPAGAELIPGVPEALARAAHGE
jgi:dipeptidyl aminopeptidase/acylaminoacyl peptidase